MNLNKIEDLMTMVGTKMKEDTISDKEYLVFVANLLISFGKTGMDSMNKFPDVNINDSVSVELTLNQNPNDVHLSSVLQGHAILKWSESVE
jgi:hypothetical protein